MLIPPRQTEIPLHQKTEIFVPAVTTPISLLNTQSEDVVITSLPMKPIDVTIASEPSMPQARAIPEPTKHVLDQDVIANLQAFNNFHRARTWNVKRDADLKTTLERWTDLASVDLHWNTSRNYQVHSMVWVEGTFEEALLILMHDYKQQRGFAPEAHLNIEPAQKPTLRIDTVIR